MGFLNVLATWFSFSPQDHSMNRALLSHYTWCWSWDSESFNTKLPEVSGTLKGRQKGSSLMLSLQSPPSSLFPTAIPQKHYCVYLECGQGSFPLEKKMSLSPFAKRGSIIGGGCSRTFFYLKSRSILEMGASFGSSRPELWDVLVVGTHEANED